MQDPRASALINLYLKYFRILYVLCAGLLVAGYTCKLENEAFLLLVGVVVVAYHGGNYVYRRVSEGGTAYHAFARTIVSADSSYLNIFMCVLLDLFLAATLLAFFIFKTSSSCQFVEIF
jgi:hypothetical protein